VKTGKRLEFTGRDLSPSNETAATGCIVSSGALCIICYDDYDDNNDYIDDDANDDDGDDDNNNIDVGTRPVI